MGIACSLIQLLADNAPGLIEAYRRLVRRLTSLTSCTVWVLSPRVPGRRSRSARTCYQKNENGQNPEVS